MTFEGLQIQGAIKIMEKLTVSTFYTDNQYLIVIHRKVMNDVFTRSVWRIHIFMFLYLTL